MKKLVLLLAVAFSVSMFSCGGGEAGNGVDSDSIKKADSIAAAQKQAPNTDQNQETPNTGDQQADTTAQK